MRYARYVVPAFFFWVVGAAVVSTAATPDAIVRKPLLTAAIEGGKTVDRVEIKEINFTPGQKTGAHLHPCPVVGYIASGSIVFQIDGQPAKTLHTGDAFFEPANTSVVRFDAVDQPVKFVAYYLLGKNDKELIRSLDQ